MAKITKNETPASAILLIHCSDQPGIVAAVTEFIHNNDGNILYLDQYVDRQKNVFFMRIEWALDNFQIPAEKIGDFFDTLLAKRYKMTWELHFPNQKLRMGIFVSKFSHCLYDILARWQSGEWDVEIPMIISNHENVKSIVEQFGIDFYYYPIVAENKKYQEKKQLDLLKEHGIDFIVLARYMRILGHDFVKAFNSRIINIHHSFLPAFPGARPYHSAYERGVKIIGATSHFVTEALDEGPIIAQDVAHVSHMDSVNDLIHKGRDLEKVVLSRAIYKYIQRKILSYENRTVIFS